MPSWSRRLVITKLESQFDRKYTLQTNNAAFNGNNYSLGAIWHLTFKIRLIWDLTVPSPILKAAAISALLPCASGGSTSILFHSVLDCWGVEPTLLPHRAEYTSDPDERCEWHSEARPVQFLSTDILLHLPASSIDIFVTSCGQYNNRADLAAQIAPMAATPSTSGIRRSSVTSGWCSSNSAIACSPFSAWAMPLGHS